MPDFTKAEKRNLRELADRIYEAEVRFYLAELESEFIRWRANEMESSGLLTAIHEFHQNESRELWSRYQSLKDPEIVARGVALAYLSESEVAAPILGKLQPLIEFFARQRE